MVNFEEFSKIIEKEGLKTILEFMSNEDSIKSSLFNKAIVPENVCGPSIEVVGKNLSYTCVLEYENVDNLKFLDLLVEKYPFINNSDVPELDVMDLLGEFLNIFCGKINLALEKVDSNLNIEIPYFTYGIGDLNTEKMGCQRFEFNNLSFKIHYCLN